MTKPAIAAVILAAGKGTRMKSDLPKVMMPLCGKPMIRYPLETLEKMGVEKIVVVTAPDGDLVRLPMKAASSVSSSAPDMRFFPPKKSWAILTGPSWLFSETARWLPSRLIKWRLTS